MKLYRLKATVTYKDKSEVYYSPKVTIFPTHQIDINYENDFLCSISSLFCTEYNVADVNKLSVDVKYKVLHVTPLKDLWDRLVNYIKYGF